jgi:hypothetical protein
MSTLEPAASPQAPAAGSNLRSDRLRVITAGRVGGMEAQLGGSGFDVVAVADTEDALIDAVSTDEPDAIVVEADLCASLEQVRELAPDALLIVIGDHTPAGALGRIEQGVSGTVMAGLLHALVAEGVGAAAVWGLVPAFGQGAGLHIPQRMSGSLLSTKADLVRAFLVNALREPAELVAVASTVAVTVSASVLLTVSAVRPHEQRPSRVPSPAPTVERAPRHPVFAVSPTTPTPVYGPSGDREPGDRRAPNRDKSGGHGRHDDEGEQQGNDDQDGDQGGDDQDGDQGGDDQDGDQGGDDQDGDQGGDDQDGNQGGDDQDGDQGGDDQDGNQGGDDQDGNQGGDDQDGNQGGDDQGEDQDTDDQGEDQDNDDQGDDQGGDDQGGDH